MGMWQALQATARQPERNGARDFREYFRSNTEP
ncbi:hypothetical protein ABIF65_010392 [Bradyrhizobium japonicum]|nr:hypothetical protein [Bradyrhizobium japonicum]MCP1783387.1 hypothetical protein [Bradyrhizobium japonicum]MCP1855556.1 hypothetical protein [Bradyrhizobium japonicum]MCP1964323.1 hypothetical protein [Bradyrhizobium japonicum]MCW2330322.1 hypothetical protein [Bradyrhizobium japonicum]